MEKIPFTVSARTARLLGRENVSNSNGAIIELIKNTYDADAKYCYIIFDYNYDDNINDSCKKINSIYIIDNGDGMTDEIIKNNWMTIGTDNKEIKQFSDSGRVKTRAKGIGRFALDKLGNKYKMLTKSKNNKNIYCWNVEWGDFERKCITINDVYATLYKDEGIEFNDHVINILHRILKDRLVFDKDEWKHGTIIKITDLRDEWDDLSLTKIFEDLEILIPPSYNKEFQINMIESIDLTKFGLVESSFCDDFDYKIEATVENNKMVDIEIYRNEFDLDIFPKDLFMGKEWGENFSYEALEKGHHAIRISIDELVPGYKEQYGADIFNDLGKFQLELYFMKRGYNNKDRKIYCYKEFNASQRSEWLNKFGGVKLFRDNFRVRPYGEVSSASFDWLMLGERADKSPAAPSHKSGAWRVRPNQIAGSINISRVNNLYFEDKSSREGIQENIQFILLKKIILRLLSYLEKDRQKVMRGLSDYFHNNDENEIDKEKGKEIAKKIIKEKKLEDENVKQKSDEKKDKSFNFEKELLAKSVLAYEKENQDLKVEIRMLRALASTGLVITSFAHELKNISARILPRSNRMKKILESLIDFNELDKLDNSMNPLIFLDNCRIEDEKLKFWLDFSLHVIRKDKRKRNKLDLHALMRNFKLVWMKTLTSREVDMNIEMEDDKELMFRVFPIDIDSIFNNLLANSLDAFRRNDASNNRKIYMKLYEEDKKLIIFYQDSGPGLNSSIKNPYDIFEPFITTKLDRQGQEIGTGLGMWIVKSTVDEYKGKIEILEELKEGFGVKLTFPLRSDEGFRRI